MEDFYNTQKYRLYNRGKVKEFQFYFEYKMNSSLNTFET